MGLRRGKTDLRRDKHGTKKGQDGTVCGKGVYQGPAIMTVV
jgi:hypothetical protein